MNFVKNEILKMWILWKMRFWNCEFCEEWVFENAIFLKIETFKMRFLLKMRFSYCDFWNKLWIFTPYIGLPDEWLVDFQFASCWISHPWTDVDDRPKVFERFHPLPRWRARWWGCEAEDNWGYIFSSEKWFEGPWLLR